MREKLERIGEYKWKISKSGKMRVPGIIYANDEIIRTVEDGALQQVANAATLPGIVKASLAMPDIHFGYGLPIGGVIATNWEEGIVSPGGVGFDINCGLRLIRTNLKKKDIEKRKKKLIDTLFRKIPSGVGSKGKLHLSHSKLKEVLEEGARWAVKRGYGKEEDLSSTESYGRLPWAVPDEVSQKALERGKNQLGTLGSGNHFVEVQVVDQIYDEKIAKEFGLEEGKLTIMIHTGSRGFGHQVATDSLVVMERALSKYKIWLPDKQLACAPISSPEGERYLRAMASAANFAWANRQIIMHWLREAFMESLGMSQEQMGLNLIYDHAHNIIKKEVHTVDGKRMTLAVHRKGATRAFPPGHSELPPKYRETGQPVIIPGDMGRFSYLLVGSKRAMDETFGSSCHGAGRLMSRHKAVKEAKGRSIEKELASFGILVRSASRRTVTEEMPEAYKNVSLVVETIVGASISRKVARMRPLLVIKG